MKILNTIMMAAIAVALVSCGGSKEKTTYSLDTKSSSLTWKGAMSAEYFHTGTVNFTEGSIEMEGDKLLSGTFTIDMNTITSGDDNIPAEKKEYLNAHLKDTAFFFAVKFPNVTVNVDGYENGKLSTMINVRGQEIKQNIPVELVHTEKNVTIAGKFSIDFAALKMPGMEPDPTTGEKIQSLIEYDLNLTLNKK
jgi:polyisoprenoid-binding protein YceI